MSAEKGSNKTLKRQSRGIGQLMNNTGHANQPSQVPNIANTDQLANTNGRYSGAEPNQRNSLNEHLQESANRGRKNSMNAAKNNLEKGNGHPDSAAINKIRLAHLVKRTPNRKDSSQKDGGG